MKSKNGQKIKFKFKSFKLTGNSPTAECNGKCCDYVMINNGKSKKKYCGEDIPNTIVSKRNKMTIEFITDYRYSDTGFFATICCDITVKADVIGKFCKLVNILDYEQLKFANIFDIFRILACLHVPDCTGWIF